ncbi:MAG TPA: hypothetical protein VL306_00235 [Methylomirabilota bacterium]|nr:hypothetical protein [Methylomirabilota bacterium]
MDNLHSWVTTDYHWLLLTVGALISLMVGLTVQRRHVKTSESLSSPSPPELIYYMINGRNTTQPHITDSLFGVALHGDQTTYENLLSQMERHLGQCQECQQVWTSKVQAASLIRSPTLTLPRH